MAPPTDAAVLPALAEPLDALRDTLQCLKEVVCSNFTAAFTLISSAAMGMHYEVIPEKYGMCPTPVAIGPKNTGKSTAGKTTLALLGPL